MLGATLRSTWINFASQMGLMRLLGVWPRVEAHQDEKILRQWIMSSTEVF